MREELWRCLKISSHHRKTTEGIDRSSQVGGSESSYVERRRHIAKTRSSHVTTGRVRIHSDRSGEEEDTAQRFRAENAACETSSSDVLDAEFLRIDTRQFCDANRQT